MLKYTKYSLLILLLIFIITDSPIIIDYYSNKTLFNQPNSIGSKDDPNGRANWEFMRIRNPQTNSIPDQIRQKELKFAKTLPRKDDHLYKGLNTQTETWKSRGPYNVGGRTRALAIDVTNENIILAGGVSGGMWRSINGGSSWTKTTSPEQLHSVTCLVQDTRSGKTNIWYYGTGEYANGKSASGGGNGYYRGDGIFKSVDGGESWNIVDAFSTDTPESFDSITDYVFNIKIDSNDLTNDILYVATYGGVFKSIDGGLSKSYVLGSGTSPWSRYSDLGITNGSNGVESGILYSALSSEGIKKGIWRSVDGNIWKSITPVGWPDEYKRTLLSIAPSNENIVYFLSHSPGYGKINSDGDGHSLWKYTYLNGDGTGSGGLWEDLSNYIPSSGGKTGDYDSQSSYNMLLKIKPDNENTVFIGGRNLYRSTDGFSSTSNTSWIGGYNSGNETSTLR